MQTESQFKGAQLYHRTLPTKYARRWDEYVDLTSKGYQESYIYQEFPAMIYPPVRKTETRINAIGESEEHLVCVKVNDADEAAKYEGWVREPSEQTEEPDKRGPGRPRKDAA